MVQKKKEIHLPLFLLVHHLQLLLDKIQLLMIYIIILILQLRLHHLYPFHQLHHLLLP
jgi:hypothetical protein